MHYCHHCGSTVGDDARVCGQCGTTKQVPPPTGLSPTRQPQGPRYAFISYSRADSSYVESLAGHLKACGVDFWYDYHAERGEPYPQIIANKIEACGALIVVMTPKANASTWVNNEVLHAIEHGKPILPLLLKGTGPLLAVKALGYEDVRTRLGGRMPSDEFIATLRHNLGLPDEPPRRRLATTRRRLMIAGALAGAAVSTGVYEAMRPETTPQATPSTGGTSPSIGSTPNLSTTLPPSTPQVIRTLDDHTRMVTSVAWSRDGLYIATSGYDHTAKIWNATTGELLHTLEGHTDYVQSVAWSPDGTRLATGSTDGTSKIWNARTGKLIRALGCRFPVAWSPDGAYLATSSADGAEVYAGTARIWDANSGRSIRTFKGPTGTTNSVDWSPDGAHIATASLEPGFAKIWDAKTGQSIHTLETHAGAGRSVQWSPNGAFLLTAFQTGVRIWNPRTAELVRTIRDTNPTSAAWSPDGTLIATASPEHRAVKIWIQADGKLLYTLGDHDIIAWSVAWSPDGSRLATTNDFSVWIWYMGHRS